MEASILFVWIECKLSCAFAIASWMSLSFRNPCCSCEQFNTCLALQKQMWVMCRCSWSGPLEVHPDVLRTVYVFNSDSKDVTKDYLQVFAAPSSTFHLLSSPLCVCVRVVCVYLLSRVMPAFWFDVCLRSYNRINVIILLLRSRSGFCHIFKTWNPALSRGPTSSKWRRLKRKSLLSLMKNPTKNPMYVACVCVFAGNAFLYHIPSWFRCTSRW